jgi:hypothetical protein
LVHEFMNQEDASPVVFDTHRADELGGTDGPRSRWVQPYQAPPLQSDRSIASCTIASFSVVFRYGDRTSATLPGDGRSSFLPCSPGGAPGISPFAGLIPQAGDQASLPDRAHVSLRASRPPRLIFVGVIGRPLPRLWREIGKASDRGLSRWRDARLLGFAPVCGPHPQQPCRGPILPWALPLAGLSGAMLRIRPGSTPIGSSTSASPRPLFHAAAH